LFGKSFIDDLVHISSRIHEIIEAFLRKEDIHCNDLEIGLARWKSTLLKTDVPPGEENFQMIHNEYAETEKKSMKKKIYVNKIKCSIV
jgi:hypothetical protein